MRFKAYLYPAYTQAELEQGDRDSEPEYVEYESLQEALEGIAQHGAEHDPYGCCMGAEPSCSPPHGGEWLYVYFQNGVDANLFSDGFDLTAASVKRLMKIIPRHV